MNERNFEQQLKGLFSKDLSAGTEAFREDLLARCLDVLGSEAQKLADDELEMLSAAGDVTALTEDTDRTDGGV